MVNDQGERCRKASASLPLLYQWKKITTFAAAATSKLASSYVPSCQYYDIEVWSHARKKQLS